MPKITESVSTRFGEPFFNNLGHMPCMGLVDILFGFVDGRHAAAPALALDWEE